MRIVHVKDYLIPLSLSYQEMSLARQHAKLGHEVHIISSNHYNPIIYPAVKAILGDRMVEKTGLFIEDGIKTRAVVHGGYL